MTTKEQDQFALHIREYIIRTAKALNLKLSFASGRRESDLIVVKLKGEPQDAGNMINCLVDAFSEIDIDALNKPQKNGVFTFIVTRKPVDQEVILKERRAKLKKILGAEIKMPNQPLTQEDLHTTLFPGNI